MNEIQKKEKEKEEMKNKQAEKLEDRIKKEK